MHIQKAIACSSVVIGALIFGCSSEGSIGDQTPAKDIAAGGDGAPGNDIPVRGDGGPSGPMRGCSGDLRNVINEKGDILATCPSDQGCFEGACIPACSAAAASKGNVGCDFVVATPMSELEQSCFALSVTNNWPTPAHLTVRYGTQTFDVTTLGHIPNGGDPSTWPAVTAEGLPPLQVAVLYLSREGAIPCGSTPAIQGRTSVPTPGAYPYQIIGRGTAFHITSDVPISAYDIYPFGGASSFQPSGTLAMPTSAWGTNYVAVIPPKSDTAVASPVLQVLGSVDGTTVTIVPTVKLPAGPGVPEAPANIATTFTLNAGEYIEWHPRDGSPVIEISGTIVSADKPVAVVGGSGELLLTSKTSTHSAFDQDHEIIPPVSALGSTYVAAPFVTRQKSGAAESLSHRIVGLVDGTLLTYDPPVPGAPASLSLGQVLDFEATSPFVVTSQDATHPFYLALLTSGGIFADGTVPGVDPALQDEVFTPNSGLGDPELDTFLPPAQFLQRYVFFTDPTYATTTLTIVRSKTSSGFADVTVDCIGTVTGFKPIGAAGNYEVAYVDLKRAKQPVGSCTDGGHVASSTSPFGITVRGWDFAASYGYSAGGNASTINPVVVAAVPR